MQCPHITEIIGGKRYSTQSATKIADDVYWDGHNMERHGTNTFLFRTPKGNYFVVRATQWQGQRDTLTPLSEEDAVELWESLPEKAVSFEAAFPNRTVEDA